MGHTHTHTLGKSIPSTGLCVHKCIHDFCNAASVINFFVFVSVAPALNWCWGWGE